MPGAAAAIGYLLSYLWVWPIRKRGDFDIQMDSTAKTVRWLVVIAGLAGSPQTLPIAAHPIALALRLTSGAFFVWPNCGYHLTWLLRRLRVLPSARPPVDPDIKRMGFWGPEY